MENLLLKKLQVKAGFKIYLINAPANFTEIIGDATTDHVTFDYSFVDTFDAMFIFAIHKVDLIEALEHCHKLIGPKTICWIFYPKSKSALASDLNLMQSWKDLTHYQLTPCGSAAIDSVWTAMRIKPVSELKRSGLGNAEIQKSEFAEFIDVKNKTIVLTEDISAALAEAPQALSNFEKLAYSNRKEYVLWILTAKQEKTRIDRLNKMVDKLLNGKKNPSEK